MGVTSSMLQLQEPFISIYELWTRVCLEKLKDAEDASCYLGVFEDARHRFVEMGMIYIHEESIFDLL